MKKLSNIVHVRLEQRHAMALRSLAESRSMSDSAFIRDLFVNSLRVITPITPVITPVTGQEEVKEVGVVLKQKKENYKPSLEALELATLLASRIVENNPKHKVIPETQVNQWAHEADLTHGRDKRSWEDLRVVLEWCQADPFWKSNILSMGTLRKQFDKLWMKMQHRSGREGSTSVPPAGTDYMAGHQNWSEEEYLKRFHLR